MSKQINYYDIIQNKATKVAEVLIYGVIGDSWWEESITAKQFVSDFRNLEKDHDQINVRINSPGGSVFDGLAIFNAISNSSKEIHTYNDGLCASMASVLLLAADKDKVHPAKNSLLMLHSPMTGAWGNRKEIENALNVLDKVQKALVTSICDKTGLDETEVENTYFDYSDHWLTADEAREAGFYDQVEEDEVENVPQNASAMKFTDLVKVFEPAATIFPDWISRIAPQANPSNNIDMDIKKLREAYNLTEEKYPTEDDVLNYVKQREQEFTNLEAAKTKAETDLATANQSIKDKDAEIANLKNKPGAPSAQVDKPTDKNVTGEENEDKGAEDFGTAFAECMNIIKPKK